MFFYRETYSNFLSQLEKDGFEGNPYYYLLVAKLDNQIIGFCFYFIRYILFTFEDMLICMHRKEALDNFVNDYFEAMKLSNLLFP